MCIFKVHIKSTCLPMSLVKLGNFGNYVFQVLVQELTNTTVLCECHAREPRALSRKHVGTNIVSMSSMPIPLYMRTGL